MWFLLLTVFSIVSECVGNENRDTLQLKNVIGAASNDSLMWGPYRPNLYFGMRSRSTESPLFGMLWHNLDNFQQSQCKWFEIFAKR